MGHIEALPRPGPGHLQGDLLIEARHESAQAERVQEKMSP